MRQSVSRLRGAISRATGRSYRIDVDKLDEVSVAEFERLLRDMEYDSMARARRAQTMPWRRP